MSVRMVALAYVLSIFGGGILARAWVIHLKKSIDRDYDPKLRRSPALDWSIGCIERGIATTLVIWAPALAATFVGGWITLKFAANWGKRDSGKEFDEQESIARHRLTGLIGSVVSLSVAIGAGIWAHPHSLTVWQN